MGHLRVCNIIAITTDGDAVDTSRSGVYRLEYNCEAWVNNKPLRARAVRIVAVTATGCANLRLRGFSAALDGVYTLTTKVINGRGVFEQECGAHFMWWLHHPRPGCVWWW